MRLKNPKGGLDLLSRLKYNQVLVGNQNGLNRFFTSPHKFFYDPTAGFEPVFKRNGNTIYLGNEIKNISESGGAGTGYDIIEFKKPPKKTDVLTADYLVF